MLTTSSLLPNQNICKVLSVNCDNSLRKLHVGQTQMVSESPKVKHDAYISVIWEKCTATLSLEDTEIPVVDEYEFLGVIFDRKLIFIPHMKYLKRQSTRVQQLQVVAHTEWVANRQMHLKLYRSLIHSKLDYAIFIYGLARRSYSPRTPQTDVWSFQNFSSCDTLYAKAYEVPLQLRGEKLALQYYPKFKFYAPNPTYDCILNPKYKQHRKKEKNQ